jgi:DUF4097 and DUF4098 domain-containing protein YvlB
MRVTTAVTMACAVVMAAPAAAQDVQVKVKIDREVAAEIRSAVRDAIQSDLGQEIADAVRDATREVTRAVPALRDLTSGAWQDRNFRAEQSQSETRTLSLGPNGTLSLKNISGDITVAAGAGRDVTVAIVRKSRGRTDADAKTGLDRVKVEVTSRGDRGTVESVYPSEHNAPYSVSVSYTVTAPAGTRITASSVSGGVSVKGITGDVSVDVVSGGINVSDGANLSSATTISGDVTVSNVNVTGTITVSTVSGSISLTQVKCRRITAGVVSGDVVGRDVTCDNAELKSISGDVEYSGALARSGRYDFQAHSGAVKLTFSGSVGFDLQASTFSGQVRLEPAIQLQRSTISRRSVRGTVGDGGAVVTATAFSGDVVIVKK